MSEERFECGSCKALMDEPMALCPACQKEPGGTEVELGGLLNSRPSGVLIVEGFDESGECIISKPTKGELLKRKDSLLPSSKNAALFDAILLRLSSEDDKE
jgi:hypothetical protein